MTSRNGDAACPHTAGTTPEVPVARDEELCVLFWELLHLLCQRSPLYQQSPPLLHLQLWSQQHSQSS
eukprot:4636556-Amphidinium_carterae.1